MMTARGKGYRGKMPLRRMGETPMPLTGGTPVPLPMPLRRGTVMIVTMWVILVLVGVVLVLSQTMRVEIACSANNFSSLQADAVEHGAIQYVLSQVDSLDGLMPQDVDMPCEAVSVGDGAFWILKPNYDNPREFAYGLVDESGKINLNTADSVMLSALPNIPVELWPAIMDWRSGADSTPTPGGARSEYYMLLSDPYQCKSSSFETVEELFLVKSCTGSVMYGEDINRNGVLDDNEDDGDTSDPPDNRDGNLDRGIWPFVTVYSAEPNPATSSDGTARVDLSKAVTSSGTNPRISDQMLTILGKNLSNSRLSVVIDNIRNHYTEKSFQSPLGFAALTGLTADEFEPMEGLLRSGTAQTLKGLVNVNTAPREVLSCLPGLDTSDVDSLIAQRQQEPADSAGTAWVLSAIKPEKIVQIGRFVTGKTYVFSADIVSVAADGRAFRRCRVIIDAQSSPPKVIYRQDLTHLGWPLPKEYLQRLRSGGSLADLEANKSVLQESTR